MKGLLNSVGHDFIFYQGSLTHSPCTQDVNWFLFFNPLRIDTGVVDSMINILKNKTGSSNNARSPQDFRQRHHYKFGNAPIPGSVVPPK